VSNVREEVLAVLIVEACQDPDLVGRRIEIRSNEVLIGRSPECDVVIPFQPVSRKHALISVGARTMDRFLTMDEIPYEGSAPGRVGSLLRFNIQDGDPMTGEGSTYGTFVDNVRVPEAERLSLSDGSRIRLGRSIAEGRIPPVILVFHDLREEQHEEGSAELTIDASMADRPYPGSRPSTEHQGNVPPHRKDQAARTESMTAEGDRRQTFATERFDLGSDEDETPRSEGEGTDPDVMLDR
jgi:pSer/pThr/pTyr-binding forkhead associated (FHA) protein